MTLEEKLANFEESATKAATLENEKMIREYQEYLDNEFEEKKLQLEEEAAVRLKTESDRLHSENNKLLSSLTLDSRRTIRLKSEEYTDLIFNDVEKKLTEFKKTSEYLQVLTAQIKAALEFARGSEMIIYIDPSDEGLKEELEKQSGHAITVSRTEFKGGTRAVIKDQNILIDDSFLTRLEEQKNIFSI